MPIAQPTAPSAAPSDPALSEPAVSEFDRATASRLREPGVHDVDLSGDWAIGPAVNGGYLLSTVARALGKELPHPHPFSITAHYLSASAAGPGVIRTETVRAGRTLSTGTASLTQYDAEGRAHERLRVLASYGDLDALADDVRTSARPPELPPIEKCPGKESNPGGNGGATLADRLDLRMDPATCGWAVGAPSGRGEIRGWFQFADGRDADAYSLLTVVDALPPTAFELGLSGWVPTVELTAHVRARPAPGPLRVAITTRNLAGGFLEEDVEVWDTADRLVAQARQLARPRL